MAPKRPRSSRASWPQFISGRITFWNRAAEALFGYTREELVNDKARLYELGGTLPDQHFKWDKKKAAEERGNGHH